MKKILAILLALTMVVGLGLTVWANTVDSGKGGDASITITLPTEQTAPTGTTTYKIYKVFDATNDGESDAISYRLVDGKTTAPAGFTVDAAGNVTYTGTGTDELTADDITAIAAYVTDTDLVYTAEAPAGETSITITGLEYGYYYITTSSGSVVTVDSTNPNAEVVDKNVLPVVDKSPGTEYDEDSLQAIAEVGTSQDYTAQINVGKGTVNLVFTDTMTNQTYNGDAKVTVGGTEVTAGDDTFTISGAAGDSTFSITFKDEYIAGLDANTIITINYSGTITSDALSTDPATNKASISSGDGNSDTSETVETYNAKFTVTKNDGKSQALPGAGFVIKNAEGKYYKLSEDKKSITWYELPEGTELADAIAAGNITEYISGSDGKVESFTGLGAGTYTLVESTTPAGYNTAADSTFTITDSDFTTANLEQEATVVNESGAELPSTGGIGTTIFYIVGGLMAVGAGVVLVTKKRMGKEEL